jgi:simple sugar transport system substrate-binding protein
MAISRWLGRLALGTCLLGLVGSGLFGCGRAAADDDSLTVGIIYIGPRDDYGYNQAHARGAAALKSLSGVKVTEEERVPDTSDSQHAMASMIEEDGAKVIFPTSFGYFDPHVLVLARKYPEVTFVHCGGLWEESKHPKNVASFFGYIDECQYINGVVAGHTTHKKKLGFVAGKPIPQVLRNINAFALGARSVDPSITVQVIFTGDWSLSTKEADAATALINQNVDVITCHVNSPKVVIETARKAGIYICGYHDNQSILAPDLYLTGAEWNWGKVYTDYVKLIQAGKRIPNMVRGGLKEGFVKMSPYGKAVSAEARKAGDAARVKLTEGSLVIFKGPLRDNKGSLVIPAGREYRQKAIELEKMSYLVEGVIGE